jgi:hypothetical protein
LTFPPLRLIMYLTTEHFGVSRALLHPACSGARFVLVEGDG